MKKLIISFFTMFSAFALTLCVTPVEAAGTQAVVLLQQDNKTEIEKEELPQAVQNKLEDKRFANWTVEKIQRVTKTDNTVYYTVDFNTGGQETTTVKFDAQGNVMN